MFRNIRFLSTKVKIKFPTKVKNKFPTRVDSIKNLENNDYNKITNEFKSYGSFVNFCISETISVKSKQRIYILKTFFEKQQKNISKRSE